METKVNIIGAGLAGSEAALQLAMRGIPVRLFEMRPAIQTPVHQTGNCAELVCSNSLKSTKPESAAGMLKRELAELDSQLLNVAYECAVAAGGALAVDREKFSAVVTQKIEGEPLIELVRQEIDDIPTDSTCTIVASGPLTSDALSRSLRCFTGVDNFAFYDAAAPIVLADSLNHEKLFRQSRYEEGEGDYLNAPFSKDEYEQFIAELISAERVIAKEFETKDLFQACQPIEEIARKGVDAPRFGTLKPVGLTDPRTGRRPWAALQLRAENEFKTGYNLVGFQTNLTFKEQKRVFRMIPGLEQAEFARFGVMHKNTFLNAPQLVNENFRFRGNENVFVAGQLEGTEGYCEAIMSGLYVALSVYMQIQESELPPLPLETATGSLFSYATSKETLDYQPMHVNFGIIPPLEKPIRNKKERYAAYAERGAAALERYLDDLRSRSVIG